MNQLTNEDVQAFIELLVTFGGVNSLDSNMVILEQDGTPHMIQDGDKSKPVQILHNGMVRDYNNYILNPLKMIEGSNPALNWFYMSRMLILSGIIKEIVLKVVELSVSKETENYDVLDLLNGVSESCDKLTISELAKINPADYFRIFYNKKTRTAEAQTMIFNDDIEAEKKLRKKTWVAVRNLMRNLFKLEKDETNLSKYSYHATILSFPEHDAKLHVMSQIIDLLDPWIKMVGHDLRGEEFKKHLENLESYVRMFAWFTAKNSQDKLVVSNHAPAGLPVKQNTNPVIPSVPSVAPAVPVIPTAPAVPTVPVATPTYGIPAAPSTVVSPFTPAPAYPQMAPVISQPAAVVNPYQPVMTCPPAMPTMPGQVVNPYMPAQPMYAQMTATLPSPIVEKPVIKMNY